MSDSEVAVDPLRDTDGRKVAVASKATLLTAGVFFFMTICFLAFLYIYSKRRFGPGAPARTGTDHDHDHDHNHEDGNNPRAIRTRGLNPDAIKSLPVVVFEPKDFKDGMECAVCLSELVEGQKARLLPQCNHGFHIDCIDMWLFSHSTCPLCRNSIGTQLEFGSDETPEVDSTGGSVPEPASLPTNVLFWGTPSGTVQETHSSAVVPPATSSSSEGTLVIEIPRRELDGFPSSSGNAKSPMASTPTSTRLRSLTRLLSGGSRVVGLGCGSPGGAVDIEQGVVGISNGVTPKTPTNL